MSVFLLFNNSETYYRLFYCDEYRGNIRDLVKSRTLEVINTSRGADERSMTKSPGKAVKGVALKGFYHTYIQNNTIQYRETSILALVFNRHSKPCNDENRNLS